MGDIEEMAAWVLEQARGALQDARRDLEQAQRPGWYGCQDSLHEEAEAQERLADAEAKLAILDLYEQQAARTGESALQEDRAWTLEPVVRLLAWGYRHRDGWQQGWAP